jgi:hypothetical protein
VCYLQHVRWSATRWQSRRALDILWAFNSTHEYLPREAANLRPNDSPIFSVAPAAGEGCELPPAPRLVGLVTSTKSAGRRARQWTPDDRTTSTAGGVFPYGGRWHRTRRPPEKATACCASTHTRTHTHAHGNYWHRVLPSRRCGHCVTRATRQREQEAMVRADPVHTSTGHQFSAIPCGSRGD